jgi:aminoglycoside phosphotransferase family enzyme
MIDRLVRKLGGELIQTHTSWVIVLDRVVYKIKKPVNFGFLDYSTLEKRRENCEKEVLLNRRLCRRVYLGVVPISEVEDEILVEDDRNIVEYAVKMLRIPEESLLSNRLATVSAEDMKRLAGVVWEFHKRAERVDEFGKPEVMRYNTDENFQQTEAYVGRTISSEDYDFIRLKTERFYEKHGEVFYRRMEEGRVRDGHGDIRLEHVAFLEDGVCIFDCIEFNDRFRYGDVLNDMCFLSMELDFAGYGELAKIYEGEYKRLSKDPDFELMLPFFKCYRAYVRGKVASFLLDDPHVDSSQKEEAMERARRLFLLSRRYAESIAS